MVDRTKLNPPNVVGRIGGGAWRTDFGPYLGHCVSVRRLELFLKGCIKGTNFKPHSRRV
jgi:hypothetical protein